MPLLFSLNAGDVVYTICVAGIGFSLALGLLWKSEQTRRKQRRQILELQAGIIFLRELLASTPHPPIGTDTES